MSKWVHKILSKDIEKRTGVCAVCGVVRLRKKKGSFLCAVSQDRWRGGTIRTAMSKYRLLVDKKCSICGFIPKKICQMDIHHIDGNHKNNKFNNLTCICANCHRLIPKKTRHIDN